MMCINSVAATCNVMVITDPTGKDPNGAAAGSMSFADNMFQSAFLMSKEHHFAVLSGGTGGSDSRLDSIVDAVASLMKTMHLQLLQHQLHLNIKEPVWL